MVSARQLSEPSRVVSSVEELERISKGTYHEVVTGGMVRIVPDMNRATMANLRFGQMPPVTGYDSMFTGFLQPGSQEWKEYFSTRKVVDMVSENGGGRVEVTSNLNEYVKPEDIVHVPVIEQYYLQAINVDDPADFPEEVDDLQKPTRKPRRYNLVDLLRDSYLLEKFGFSEVQLNTIKNMSVADPDQAAAKAQAYIRQRVGSENAVVSAGKFSRSKAWAKESLRYHSRRFPEVMAACDSVVYAVRKEVIVYGPDGPGSWFVSGPISLVPQLMEVHRMVAVLGTASPMFALGTELTVLNINIHNGSAFECPTMYYHAGPHEDLPEQSSDVTRSLLSADGMVCLESLRKNLEVVSVDLQDCATAVRISSRHVLINTHILEQMEAGDSSVLVSGKPVQPVRLLSGDLWLVRAPCERDVAWSLREPEVGESVIVCYMRHDKMCYTSPISIRGTDGQSIVMSKTSELLPGVSGGAIVALSDFSLLGVYEGSGLSTAMASVFSQEMFTDVCTMDRATVADHDEASGTEDTVYSRMRDRGLRKYLEAAIFSLEPLYSGALHVGMGYVTGGHLVTTCNPDKYAIRVGKLREGKTFDPVPPASYSTAVAPSGRGALLHRRPVFGEQVFVVGIDDEGPYFSSVESKVIHVGLSAKNFTISVVEVPGASSLVGGLVVAVADAAVVGQYVRHSVSEALGHGGYCTALPDWGKLDTAVSSFEEVVEKKFPFLHPKSWPEGTAEEIFSHSSVQKYSSGAFFNSGNIPFAFIGDSAMKALLGVVLREQNFPCARWQISVQADMSNVALAARAESFDLHKHLNVGTGVHLQTGSKAHADVLEALAGVVYLYETTDVFRRFCEVIGVVREAYVSTPVLSNSAETF